MYTKLIVKIQIILLFILCIISLTGFLMDNMNIKAFIWLYTNTLIEDIFISVYALIFFIAIFQVIFALLEAKIYGLLLGAYALLSFIPLVNFLIIPISISILIGYKITHKKKLEIV